MDAKEIVIITASTLIGIALVRRVMAQTALYKEETRKVKVAVEESITSNKVKANKDNAEYVQRMKKLQKEEIENQARHEVVMAAIRAKEMAVEKITRTINNTSDSDELVHLTKLLKSIKGD